MASEPVLFLVHLSVVILILAIQVWLWQRARAMARAVDEADLETYLSRFLVDLTERARRGQSPDWTHYRTEIERLFDRQDERLRVLAAAALATGLGGTMLALIATFLVHQGSPTDAAGPLIHGLGVALFGSFAGVVNHLFILLHVLPQAEDRFSALGEAVLGKLRAASLEKSPVQLFTQTFQEELSVLRRSLSAEFGQRLSESITDLPQAVKALGSHMDRLGEVVEAQASNADSAVEEIKNCSVLVADSSANLVPAAQQLADSADQLLGMPEALGSVLDTGRQEWIERLRQEQEEARSELFRQVRLLQEGSAEREIQLQSVVTDIRATLGAFPERLAEEVKGLFDGLQSGLSQELSGYLSELRKRLSEDHDRLVKTVIQDWNNNIFEVVNRVLDEAASEVEDRLASPLEEASHGLSQVAAQLPDVAKRLETAHNEWMQAQDAALSRWRDAGESIDAAAKKLTNGNARLEDAVSALCEGADQLERVALSTNGFESSLQSVLKEAAERQYEHLRPLHQEVGRVVDELRGQFDATLTEQSQFIRTLIEQLLRGRENLAREAQA